MPIYQVVTSGVDLAQDERERLAKGFTAIHHDETQAPEPFIRIVFQPMPLGLMYTAGNIEPSFILSCGIRAGRSEITRQNIMRRCNDLILEVTNLPLDQIFVAAPEEQSGRLMEAGLILPEPTPEAEAAWMRQLNELMPGKFDQYV